MGIISGLLDPSVAKIDDKIEKKAKKLEILDGYRGFLATLVVIQHILNTYDKNVPRGDYHLFDFAGYYIGVSGFFVLSAFLLTFRLLTEYDESNNSNRIILLRTLQYAIRRFFRIYLVFITFYALACFGPSILRIQIAEWRPFTTALLLRSVGRNYLWTIPCEIKYYFCIPFICYAFHKSGKLWLLLWTLVFITTFYVGYYNPFKIPHADFISIAKGDELRIRITSFLSGSLVGIVYFHLKKQKKILQCIENTVFIQHLLSLIVVILFIFQFKYFTKGWNPKLTFYDYTFLSALYQAVMLMFFMFNTKNFVTAFYSLPFLKSCGKYSFGMYLFHAVCISAYYKNPIEVRFIFEMIIIIVVASYLAGVVWFHVLERHLMNIANYLCKKLAVAEFFNK